jgi:hypothetical protein
VGLPTSKSIDSATHFGMQNNKFQAGYYNERVPMVTSYVLVHLHTIKLGNYILTRPIKNYFY